MAQLRRLNPRLFEQLTFDLLTIIGLRNSQWRSPGADGGRDIQGVFPVVDLSEAVNHQSWYVECKRYGAAVDWPTVRDKLAYAENHQADFLLIVTTGHLSPTCKQEIEFRTVRRDRPFIRYWDAPVLELMVARYPQLLVKYRLGATRREEGSAVLPLVRLSAKIVQSVYASGGASVGDAGLEFAAAVVELIDARLSEVSRNSLTGRLRPFRADRDGYQWLQLEKNVDLSPFDQYSTRAFVTALRFYFRVTTLAVEPSGKVEVRVRVPNSTTNSAALTTALTAILPWSNFSAVRKGRFFVLRPHRG